MKKLLLTAAFLATTFSIAQAGVHFGISIGFPVAPAPRVVYVPPPPVCAPAPPACAPQYPVVVYRPPVVVMPHAPVVVAPAPVVPPGFYFGYGTGWHHRPHHGWRGCR